MSGAPIVHISIPVEDVGAAASFYEEVVGCHRGRTREGFVDVWFFGAQLTLVRSDDRAPDSADDYAPHFGAIVPRSVLDDVWARLRARRDSNIVSPPTTTARGTPLEQTKMMFLDRDGHAIELKCYGDVSAALGTGSRVSCGDG